MVADYEKGGCLIKPCRKVTKQNKNRDYRIFFLEWSDLQHLQGNVCVHRIMREFMGIEKRGAVLNMFK